MVQKTASVLQVVLFFVLPLLCTSSGSKYVNNDIAQELERELDQFQQRIDNAFRGI